MTEGQPDQLSETRESGRLYKAPGEVRAARGLVRGRFASLPRLLTVAATISLVLVATTVGLLRWQAADASGAVAIDYRTFVDEGHRVVDSGTPYLDWQLTGPYESQPSVARQPGSVPSLYPPAFVVVNLALLVVPWPTWWIVPLTILGYALWRWRPRVWAWPLLAACLCWPATSSIVIVGGTTMWIAALVAAGLLWRWPASLIALKPTFLPLALMGVRSRAWWALAALMAVVSIPLLPDYLSAMGNVRDANPLYSLGDVPFVLLPVIAWLARTVPDKAGSAT